MRIDRLLLTAFGCFQGRELALAPGLTVIYGENESGKSTIQKFLLGMLYGFKKRAQRRDYTEDVARYRPWAGHEYRGALEYTLDGGRRWRAERQFEPGRDEVRLYDAVTGADLTAQFQLDRRKELLFAEAQLGLPEEVFRSTACIGQMEVSRMEMGRELVARVANLQDSGREELSVRAALAVLDDRVREIGSERAPAKPYGKVLKAIEEHRQELDRAGRVREETLDWETRLTEVRGILAELDEELAELTRRLHWALFSEAEARLTRVTEAGRRTREGRARATRPELDAPAQQRLAMLQEQAHRLVQEIAGLDRQISPPGAPETGGPWSVMAGSCAVLGLVMAGYGRAMLGHGWVMAGLWLALGLVMAGIAWYLRVRRQSVRAEQMRRVLALTARREGQQARLEQLHAEIAGLPRESQRRAAAEADALEAALRSLLGGDSPEALEAEVEELGTHLEGEEPVNEGSSPAQLREEIRRLEGRRAALLAQASDLGARVETITRELPDTAELRRAFTALQEEKAGYDEELAALQLARETLAEAAAEMHRDFAPRLNEAMGEIVSRLTGGRYGTVRIDESMAIRAVTEGGRTVDLLSLSGGTVDQFYLGLRLALLELITGGQERVPLILDDPFVQYDDDRAQGALSFLAGLGRAQQVILLTCHRREAGMARALGATVIHLAEETA